METNQALIEEKIRSVEHPEIASTLDELGMIGDIDFNEESKEVHLTLVLPMLNIPVQIRDMIINSIAKAIGNLGSKLKVSIKQMTEEQRQSFFSLSKKNWEL